MATLKQLARFLLLLVPLPALLFHIPLWIEKFASIDYPVHASGIVVVTGASSGIGKSAALALDAGGLTVFAGVRSQADAESLLAERPSLRPIIWDVTSSAACAAAAEAVRTAMESEKKQLTGLVNNAGISHRLPFELEDMASIRALYDVNLFGAIQATQAFLPLLRNSSGRIVFVSSLSALIATPGSAIYSGAKAAIEMTADALRLELAPWRVSVSVVQPGYVRTSIASKQTGSSGVRSRIDGASSHVAELYEGILRSLDAKRLEAEAKADPPMVTSVAIAHALVAPRPRTRYLVANANGVPAWILAWVAWALPDRVQDRLVLARS